MGIAPESVTATSDDFPLQFRLRETSGQHERQQSYGDLHHLMSHAAVQANAGDIIGGQVGPIDERDLVHQEGFIILGQLPLGARARYRVARSVLRKASVSPFRNRTGELGRGSARLVIVSSGAARRRAYQRQSQHTDN